MRKIALKSGAFVLGLGVFGSISHEQGLERLADPAIMALLLFYWLLLIAFGKVLDDDLPR